ncbi:MAG: DUF4405 domain-containing protein [Sedimentisphaerales bacterium]|nr:DUF4405 domain-containing protein [Sedimentisphaerales bacterium]
METKMQKKFSWRAFISILTGFSFIGIAITGVVLFFVPPGRIANWTGWTFLAISKDTWIALHDWFGIVFMITVVFHLFFNLKPFISYFKNKITKAYSFRAEWLIALVLCVCVSVGTILNTAPFANLMAWNESLKDRWDTPAEQAPIPHAELLTLNELAQQVSGVDLETMQSNLKNKGYEVGSPDMTLGELAESVSKTPLELYQIAVGQSGSAVAGTNRFGQMTLEQYCEQNNLNINEVAQKLKDAGFTIKPEMTMREIADSNGAHPSEVRNIISQ